MATTQNNDTIIFCMFIYTLKRTTSISHDDKILFSKSVFSVLTFSAFSRFFFSIFTSTIFLLLMGCSAAYRLLCVAFLVEKG